MFLLVTTPLQIILEDVGKKDFFRNSNRGWILLWDITQPGEFCTRYGQVSPIF